MSRWYWYVYQGRDYHLDLTSNSLNRKFPCFFPSGVNKLLWYVYVYTWIPNKWCDSVPDTYKLQPPGKDRVPWMSIFSAVKFSFIFYFMYMYNRLWIFISQINDSNRPRTVIVTVALLSGTLFFFFNLNCYWNMSNV